MGRRSSIRHCESTRRHRSPRKVDARPRPSAYSLATAVRPKEEAQQKCRPFGARVARVAGGARDGAKQALCLYTCRAFTLAREVPATAPQSKVFRQHLFRLPVLERDRHCGCVLLPVLQWFRQPPKSCCRFWTGGTAGAQNFRHTLCVRLPYEVLSLTEPAIAAKLLPNVFYGRQER